MKLRLQQQGGDYSNGSQTVGPITKDEEEVVETLYALADMFPSNNENGSNGELTKAKSWPLPEGENSKPPFEGLIRTHVMILVLLNCLLC